METWQIVAAFRNKVFYRKNADKCGNKSDKNSDAETGGTDTDLNLPVPGVR